MKPSKKSNFLYLIIALLFVGVLWTPCLQMWLGFFPERRNTEQRTPAARPEGASFFSSPGKFLYAYDKYFVDHFGFRNNLVHMSNLIKAKYLKVLEPVPYVIVGKEGWLFYNNETEMRRFSCSLSPYSESELAALKDHLDELYYRLKGKNIFFMIVIAPDKQSIYPEYFPKQESRISDLACMDQVSSFLRENSSVPFLDLRSPLRKAKETFPVYYKNDTHWNWYGGYIAYFEIMKVLSTRFPIIHPLQMSDFDIKLRKKWMSGDLAIMLSIPHYAGDMDIRLINKKPWRARVCSGGASLMGGMCEMETADPGLPRLVMFRDSFGTIPIKFIAEHFSKSVFWWEDWHATFDKRIEEGKPDIVILELGERFIRCHLR